MHDNQPRSVRFIAIRMHGDTKAFSPSAFRQLLHLFFPAMKFVLAVLGFEHKARKVSEVIEDQPAYPGAPK